jgi:hypothetical protein
MSRGNHLTLKEISVEADVDSEESILAICSRFEPILADDGSDSGVPELHLF